MRIWGKYTVCFYCSLGVDEGEKHSSGQAKSMFSLVDSDLINLINLGASCEPMFCTIIVFPHFLLTNTYRHRHTNVQKCRVGTIIYIFLKEASFTAKSKNSNIVIYSDISRVILNCNNMF